MYVVNNINSNNISNADIYRYVTDFNQFARKTAEAVIGMGSVVYNAKEKLSSENFNLFCCEIRFESKSSSIRKLYQIGSKAEQLNKFADNLPCAWTTIYQLTKLSGEVLEGMIDSGKVFSTMSGNDAKQLVDVSTGRVVCSKRNTKESEPVEDVPNDGYVLLLRFDKTPSKKQVLRWEAALNKAVTEDDQLSIIRSVTLDALMSASNDQDLIAA